MEIQYESKIQGFSLIGEINHIRKNHAMEHATIHILTKRLPGVSFGGYSVNSGFWIIGKAGVEDVKNAAEIAKARLQNGDVSLAVHPNCGTNLAAAGLCTAVLGSLSMIGADTKEERAGRFSFLVLAGVVGTYCGKPLGERLQKHLTTNPNVSDLRIRGIQCGSLNGTPSFFVETELFS